MATQTLTLAGWQPTPLNKLLGMHWAKRNRVKDGDCAVIAAEAASQGVTRAAGRRRVTLRVLWSQGRGCIAHGKVDCDALLKVTLDALVRCGLLLGDGPEHVELGTPTHERITVPALKKGLTVQLEDVA